MFKNPLSKRSKNSLQSSLISLTILFFPVMLDSHSLSMMSPLICYVNEIFLVLDVSSLSEYMIALWRVTLAALASFFLQDNIIKGIICVGPQNSPYSHSINSLKPSQLLPFHLHITFISPPHHYSYLIIGL